VAKQNTGQQLKAPPKIFYGYIVVAAALLIILLAYGARLSFGVFFKPMIAEFHWSRALTSGAMTLAMLIQGVTGIVMGRLNDRFGPRFIMTFCCFFLGLGFILTSQIHSAWQLYLVFGVITGIGMGGVFVALLSTVARWFIKRRGTMTGIVTTGIGLGALVMTPAANWLISVSDWRMSYIIVGGVVLVPGIIAAQLLRRDPARMGLVPYGKNEKEVTESAAAAGGLSFKEAVGTVQFWMIAFSFFCLGYCIFAINVHLVPHITDLGISATTAANIMAATGGLQTIGGIVLGIAADRTGNRQVLIIGLVLITVSMLWLVPFTGPGMFYVFAVIYGVGVGGGGTMEATVIADLFGIKAHGLILGVTSFIFTVGGAVGPLVTGYIFDRQGSYQPAFLVCAAFGITGLILVALTRPVK